MHLTISGHFVLKTLHKKMKFPIKEFFSKCDQIRSFLRIWSHLLKKSLIEKFIILCIKFQILKKIWSWKAHWGNSMINKVDQYFNQLVHYPSTKFITSKLQLYSLCGYGLFKEEVAHSWSNTYTLFIKGYLNKSFQLISCQKIFK